MTERDSAILLVDHGSHREEAHRQLEALAQALELHLAHAGRPMVVHFAHMELRAPSIEDGVSACVERGATHIVCVPCFLSRGRHVTEDIPRLLAGAVERHPGVTFRMALPLSEQPGFVELLASAAGEL